LIATDNALYGNLMMPGPFPLRMHGDEVLESQIVHILTDYGNNRLNSETINGGSDSVWGDMSTDRPAYTFYQLSTGKQVLLPHSQ